MSTANVTATAAAAREGTTLSSSSSSCPLCCEDITSGSSMILLSKCSHESCGECLRKWLEREEKAAAGGGNSSGTSGAGALPSCPFCRIEMSEEDVLSVLGRPYRPQQIASSLLVGGEEEEMDDLTRHWLDEQTKPCPRCGARIVLDGGCAKMECLCGCRFCYRCGSHDAQCSCTPSDHGFWDNVLNDFGWYEADPAPIDEETGLVDVQARITKKRRDERLRTVRFERMSRSFYESENREYCDLFLAAKWMFCSRRTGERILEQLCRSQTVRGVRKYLYFENLIEATSEDEGGSSSCWLFCRERSSYRILQQLTKGNAVRRAREEAREEERESRRFPLDIDAVITSGSWLFRKESRTRTCRRLSRLVYHQERAFDLYMERIMEEELLCDCCSLSCEDCCAATPEEILEEENAVTIGRLFPRGERSPKWLCSAQEGLCVCSQIALLQWLTG